MYNNFFTLISPLFSGLFFLNELLILVKEQKFNQKK